MKIRILGAHGIDSRDTKFPSILIDDNMALDAGSLASGLSLREQRKVRAVLLSHSHLDHIQGIGALAMHFFTVGDTLDVYGIKDTIDALSKHVFNKLIQPDFTQMPSPRRPAVRLHTLEVYKHQVVEDYGILAVPTFHSIPSVGYEVTAGNGKSLFYSGDTGPGLSNCWQYVNPDLIIIDCAGPNTYTPHAPGLGHLTPQLLEKEFMEFLDVKGYLPPIILVHMSPLGDDAVKIAEEISELSADLNTSIQLGYEGMEFYL